MRRSQVPGEQDSLKMVGERVNAWWTAVLAGQADQPHPIQGSNISASVQGDTLVVAGQVPSEDDLSELRREADPLAGHGVAHVRVEVDVHPTNVGEKGLLCQTLVGTFENAERAGFAAGYLEGHGHVSREAMRVVEPGDEDRRDQFVETLGEPYAANIRASLEDGSSALIVTVDETEAFRVRELLDEETRSLQTLVLPPVPARTAARHGEHPGDGGNARRGGRQARHGR